MYKFAVLLVSCALVASNPERVLTEDEKIIVKTTVKPELEAVYNDYLALIKPGKTTMEEKWLLGFVGDNKTNLNAIDSYKSEKNFTSEFKSKICVPLFVEYLKIVNKIQNDANHTEKDVVTFAKECLENVKKIQEDLRHHD